jgi:hypothetical protein
MALNFKIDVFAPVNDIYVSFKDGDTYRFLPVVFMAVNKVGEDYDVVPAYWDRTLGEWADARTITGFQSIVKSGLLEAQYEATESDIRELLEARQTFSTEEQMKLVDGKVADLLAHMIAMRRIRQLLGPNLPVQVP